MAHVESHAFDVTREHVTQFMNTFDSDHNGEIERNEFEAFHRFTTVLAYLHDRKEKFGAEVEEDGLKSPV